VTELDLRHSLIPVPLIKYLAKVMPQHNDGEGYDYHSFLNGVVNGNTSNGVKTTTSVERTRSVEQTEVTGGGMARGARHYL
jgi:Ca2+ insensitive EF hand